MGHGSCAAQLSQSGSSQPLHGSAPLAPQLIQIDSSSSSTIVISSTIMICLLSGDSDGVGVLVVGVSLHGLVCSVVNGEHVRSGNGGVDTTGGL